MQNGVSGVASTFTDERPSSGPLPDAWPMARSMTTSPSRMTHNTIAGWMPPRYRRSTPCQMRSTPSRVICASVGSDSAPSVVTDSRSRGTQHRR